MIHHRRDIFLCLPMHQIDEKLLHYTIILTTCELNEFHPRCCSESCGDVLLVVLT